MMCGMAGRNEGRRGLRGIAGLSAASLFLVNPTAGAAEVPVTNPGFEDITGETPNFEFTFGPLDGWDLYDPDNINGEFIGTLTPVEPDPVGDPGVFINFPDGAAEGQRVGIAFLSRANYDNGAQGEFGMQQTLGDALQPFTRYTLSVEIGNIASGQSQSFGFFNLAGFPGYRVELLAGGVPIAADHNTLAGTIDDGDFATSTFDFTTADSLVVEGQERIGQTLGIRVVNLNVPDLTDAVTTAADLEVDFDDVRLTAELLGDMDLDDAVTLQDVQVFVQALEDPAGYAASFGVSAADRGDLTGDGVFNLADVEPFAGLFGAPSLAAIAAVPEPTAAVLLAAAGPWMMRRRRRVAAA